MRMKKSWFLLLGIVFTCCGKKKAEDTEFLSNECRKWPAFATGVGFPGGAGSAFSTSDKKHMGLLLVHTGDTIMYQHPSWKKAGWLAPIQLDKNGNLFTAPAPFINVLNNPLDSQNIVYKVDNMTGEMTVFASLPVPGKTNNENPYGILGMCYLCENDLLYVSSVGGSTREKETGGIYCIDAGGKIKDKLTGIDPFGIGICYIEGKRKLYFGKARTPEIYSVPLNAKGEFAGSPELAVSLDGLGPRGDDHAKKIRFSPKGDMIVEGFEFNFNLIASTEKQTTMYYFRYGTNTEKWGQIEESAVK